MCGAASALVLDRKGDIHRVESGAHRKVPLQSRAPAFVTEAGVSRPFYAVRGFDGGTLIASDGGVVVAGSGEPVFHAAKNSRDHARLSRVGGRQLQLATKVSRTDADDIADVGIVATCGPHVWLFREGNFQVVDLQEW